MIAKDGELVFEFVDQIEGGLGGRLRERRAEREEDFKRRGHSSPRSAENGDVGNGRRLVGKKRREGRQEVISERHPSIVPYASVEVLMIAFTREVSPSIDRCELTHLNRSPIDLELARRQHRAFEEVLAELGCEVRRLPDSPDLPDAVFVQDAAIVFDEIAIIASPGAESRRPETASVAEALAPFRPLRMIEPPGTLDGGDVICIGRSVFIGQSARTNRDGIRQVAAILEPFGYSVRSVEVTGCLHLQTAVTPVADNLLLVNPNWIDPKTLGSMDWIEVDSAEPFAANALRVDDAVIHPLEFSRTRRRLESRGIQVVPVDMSELAKAEAGVTCCCILVPTRF